MKITGRARVVRGDVYTDTIISSYRKMQAATPADAVPYIFEDLDPPLSTPLRAGDIIVAGENFGCGSAMEIAVQVFIEAGVRAVVAKSFARTYYRNAIDAGLPVAETDTSVVLEGDTLVLDVGEVTSLADVDRRITLKCSPIPAFALEVVRSGGLLAYYRRKREIPRGLL